MEYALSFSEDMNNTIRSLRIPVNPEKYGTEYPGETQTYNVLGLGEIIQARTPKLFDLSWEGVFPGSPDYPGVTTRGGFKGPKFYIDEFLRYQRSLLPVWFTAIRAMEDGTPIFSTTAQVIVEDFSYEERGGETGDFFYTIKLKEYRDYKPQVATFVQIQDEAVPMAAVVVEPQRDIPSGQLYVDCKVIINGRYHNDSYGGKPYGNASNKRGTVSKIVTTDPKRPYPVHVKSESGTPMGWLKADQLQVVT